MARRSASLAARTLSATQTRTDFTALAGKGLRREVLSARLDARRTRHDLDDIARVTMGTPLRGHRGGKSPDLKAAALTREQAVHTNARDYGPNGGGLPVV